MVRVRPIRTLTALLSLGLLAAACSSDDQPPGPTGSSGNPSGMVAVAASVDLYTRDPQRVDLGLVMPDNSFVSFGTVDVAFSLLGDAADAGAQPGPTATADVRPDLRDPRAFERPVVTQPNEGRGVYEATDVVFDTAGVWVAEVTADVEGLGPQTAQASFAVQEHPTLPAPGDRARTDQEPHRRIEGRAARGRSTLAPRPRARSPTPSSTNGRSPVRSPRAGRRWSCSRRRCSVSAGSAAR